jgi:hypothetical protein
MASRSELVLTKTGLPEISERPPLLSFGLTWSGAGLGPGAGIEFSDMLGALGVYSLVYTCLDESEPSRSSYLCRLTAPPQVVELGTGSKAGRKGLSLSLEVVW